MSTASPTFEWRGREVRVTPTPASPIEQVVWAGGSVPASAERAARLRLPFFTMSKNPAIGAAYRDACAAHGWERLQLFVDRVLPRL